MKETMIKRFFSPIWKCEEIESKLEQLENDGWRLDKISGLRKFHFSKSQPKDTKYFFTCSLVKEVGMIQTEHVLKSQFNANKISGCFLEFLQTTSVYRITSAVDLFQRKFYRNIYIKHLVLQYLLLEFFFTLLAVTGIVLSCVMNNTPLFDIRHLFFAFVGFFGLIGVLHHFGGLLYLRRQYIEYFRQTQNAASEE